LTQEALEKTGYSGYHIDDILAGVMDKKVNGTTAFMQRKIQVKAPWKT